MNKQVVIVDICNTLINLNDQLAIRGYQIDSYRPFIPSDEFDDMRILSDATPIYPVVHFVRRLAEVAEIVYLTGISKELQKITIEWLCKNNVPEAPIVFTNGRSKGKLVLEMTEQLSEKAIVIEDSPLEIESILSVQPYIHLFIPDWSYNRHIEGNHIKI